MTLPPPRQHGAPPAVARSRFALPLGALLLLLHAPAPLAARDAAGPGVGDPAPSFEAKADDGTVWRSKDHVGKKPIVVFFFPAALTGG